MLKPLSRIKQIQSLVRSGLYYLTEHAVDEAAIDGFDIYDVEYGILTGRIEEELASGREVRSGGQSLGRTNDRSGLPSHAVGKSTSHYGV